jgi:nucleoside-diphosphate-sugar epimerase
MMKQIIVVAGATGDLGHRIVNALLERGAEVRVIVRSNTSSEKRSEFEKRGVTVFSITNWNVTEISPACNGASCVVSALAGLRDVVIDAQKILLDAAIAAHVPRFIPSDYSLDFTPFSEGENRNLDWRREFHRYLDKTSLSATSIFNGAFADMLTGQMPLVLFKQKLVLFWGDADHKMYFTTKDNTAAYTACAALDPEAPRYLRIAGDIISPREMRAVVNEVSGKKYRLIRAGGLGLLSVLIKVARTMAPGEKEIYPAFQGMQYMRNMMDDRATLRALDNGRYPMGRWTTAKDVLAAHLVKK